MTSKINKNTSAIDILEKEIDLKVSATDVEEIVGDVTTTKINEAVSQINVTTNAISQKVSNVETVTNTLDGKIKSHETRIANAESKVTDSAITNVVKQAQFIKDIEGNITEVESAISSVEQTANSITSKVNGLDGKYTEIKQTVDKIDLTGKVSFSDLSTAGKTTINGSNITTGTLSADRVLGGTLKGVSLQTYSGTNTSGVRIHPGGMQLNDTSFFYNNEGKFELQCKQGVAFSSQKDIHIMPGLLASGTPSGSGTVVIPSATLRTQKLYVVNNATFESGLSTTSISASSTIRGRNYITLDRGSVYIPRLNSNITADYLRLGGAYITGADSGAIHFNYSSYRSGALARGTVYLPSGGGNNTTDHLAFHSGIIACVDSGNFHFVTAGGGNATIYPRGVVATYSLDNVARTRTTSKALDIISSVPVTQTVEGFRLDVPKARTTENEQLITTSENEQTGELDISTNYNSMLGTMWKAIQELQQEVNELKKENEELRTLLNKGE
jgi:archaellum component FlaC